MSNNFRVSIKIPGKTFLLGEYLALSGGPSLVVATNPQFVVDFQFGIGTHVFDNNSPAGRYIAANQNFFKDFKIYFSDPYQRGGFGASTAEFLGVVCFHKFFKDMRKQKSFTYVKDMAATMDFWNVYRDMHKDDKVPPSGADLIGQIVGGLSVYDASRSAIQVYDWPFDNVAVALYKTSFKIKTHDHLRTLDESLVPLDMLRSKMTDALEGLVTKDFKRFSEASRQFTKRLNDAKLVMPEVLKRCEDIEKIPGVLMARGCGAMGADVIAVYGETGKMPILGEKFPDLKRITEVPESQAYGLWVDVIGEVR